jgi:FlaA1/EpsC-like NDP-sugar epimerase
MEASSGCDQIFHFAALKCLNLYEHAPNEVLKTNIYGTYNVDKVQKNNPSIKRVVFSSTDKACYPINVYGNTKAVGEKIVSANSNNVVCRYGNVLGSRGSFLSLLIDSLLARQPVPITHRMASRFFLTIQQAASFIINESSSEASPLVRIPQMNAIYMTDLVEVISKILNVAGYQIEEVGLRPGEKIHEILSMEHEPLGLITSEESHFLPHQAFDYFSPSVNAIMAGAV